MAKWLFVLARVKATGLGSPEDISFEHTFVDAENEDDAYHLGWVTLGRPTAALGEVMNDYVVKIDGE